jgi:hypothetical protein
MSLRRSLVLKVLAVWFVVLIVLPFTAPFQVWDPGAPIGKAPSHDLKLSAKLTNDAGIAACAPSAAPAANHVIVRSWKANSDAARHSVLQTVLRL